MPKRLLCFEIPDGPETPPGGGPGGPDNTLPPGYGGGRPDRPDQGLPGGPGLTYPSQGLPGGPNYPTGGPIKPPGFPVLPIDPDNPPPSKPPSPWGLGRWVPVDPGFGKPPIFGFLPVDPGYGIDEEGETEPPETEPPPTPGTPLPPTGGLPPGHWLPIRPPDCPCEGGEPEPKWVWVPHIGANFGVKHKKK
jgi:hypothetical protein